VSSRIFWGTVLVALGVLFLLSNLGVLPWGVWQTLVKAWPLLLVVWGASILLHPFGRLGALLTALIVIVGLGAVVVYTLAFASNPGAAPGYPTAGVLPLDQPLENGTQTVKVDLDFGAGTISLDGRAPADKLAWGSLGYIFGAPQVSYSGGASAQLRVAMTGAGWSSGAGGRTPSWDIHLNPQPVYDLDLDTGACHADLDLSALKVRSLVLSTGASDTDIVFGDPGRDATARLEFGAAAVRVKVPRSVGVRVDLATGLVGTNLAGLGFTHDGSAWVSPEYAVRQSHLDIRVEGGASSFNLDWTD